MADVKYRIAETTGIFMSKTALTTGLLWLLLGIQSVMAAPAADLWPRWEVHNAGSTKKIDHQPWRDFLGRYLKPADNGINLVNYRAVSAEDRQQLGKYLDSLQAVAVSDYSRSEQFAYWVNLYNARTVFLILEHYPVESITDISFGWFSFGPWDEKLLTVEGEKVSLNDIEHRILRPIWKDNRIHYAVNCASMGCPNLAPEPFTAANSETLLEQGARDYINHPRGVTVKGTDITASKIYDWYGVDFGNNENSLVRHFLQYANPDLKKQLESVGKQVDWDYRYDWSLNEFPQP